MSSASPSTGPSWDGPPPGMRVGDYELLARLGEGGMGVVHLARRSDGERVALKVLRPQVVGDQEARERLAQEVGALRRVRSPRVAEVVDADPWGPVAFVATRYVPGLALYDQVKEEGPLVDVDLRWFARCLAEALAAVHAVGVLHRDIKPSNVLMEGRNPVLIDFGLARVADDPKLTQTGWLLGTPGYLAPEILFGDDATTASDVHSWAATVAYAGTGRSPFGRGPGMAIMDRVRRGEHDLSGLPDDIGRIVHAALDPEPSRRPDLSTLRAWLSDPDAGPDAEPEADRWTQPYAVTAQRDQDDVTDRLDDVSDDPDDSDDPATARLESPLEPQREPYQQPAPPQTRERWPVRVRRATLVGAGVLSAGAAVAAYPYLAVLALTATAWVLRSASLTSSAAARLRSTRGPRWYDAPRTVLASPWHLVRSTPGTGMLVLWAIGLALAAGLICYAVALSLTASLAVTGAVFAGSLWTGPGASRVRRPARRLIDPLARSVAGWSIALLVVVGLGVAASLLALSDGPSWMPAYSEPLLPGTFLGDLIRR